MPRRNRNQGSPLLDLEAQFDRLFQDMQTSKSKRGVKAALNASPEDLGQAALDARRKEAIAMARWETRLDLLGPFASAHLLQEALRAAPAPSPTVDFLAGYLAGLRLR